MKSQVSSKMFKKVTKINFLLFCLFWKSVDSVFFVWSDLKLLTPQRFNFFYYIQHTHTHTIALTVNGVKAILKSKALKAASKINLTIVKSFSIFQTEAAGS